MKKGKHYYEKGKGTMVRSIAILIDSDEKCSKYVFNLEKQNTKIKYIKCLINEDGKNIDDLDLILKEEEKFYKNFYNKKNVKTMN